MRAVSGERGKGWAQRSRSRPETQESWILPPTCIYSLGDLPQDTDVCLFPLYSGQSYHSFVIAN